MKNILKKAAIVLLILLVVENVCFQINTVKNEQILMQGVHTALSNDKEIVEFITTMLPHHGTGM
jgi:hypothetical protein